MWRFERPYQNKYALAKEFLSVRIVGNTERKVKITIDDNFGRYYRKNKCKYLYYKYEVVKYIWALQKKNSVGKDDKHLMAVRGGTRFGCFDNHGILQMTQVVLYIKLYCKTSRLLRLLIFSLHSLVDDLNGLRCTKFNLLFTWMGTEVVLDFFLKVWVI